MANGEQGAKLTFDPIPVGANSASTSPVEYVFELVSVYEVQGGEKVQEVPLKWWDASCFGPYNVTVDISHLRSQYSYVFPGSVYPTTIDFNGFLHSQATVVINQGNYRSLFSFSLGVDSFRKQTTEEEISIGDDSFKFDIDIRSWPFQNTSNSLILEYRISSNKENRFVITNGQQPQYILEGEHTFLNKASSFLLTPSLQAISVTIRSFLCCLVIKRLTTSYTMLTLPSLNRIPAVGLFFFIWIFAD